MNLKCLEGLHYIIDNFIIRNHKKCLISLQQIQYLITKLQEFGMFTSNSMNTPLFVNVHLSKKNHTIKEEHMTIQGYPYFQVVGNLMHAIINIKSDCYFVVNSLAQYFSNPRVAHIQTLK
jgi:hypothetical protein